MTGSAGFQIQPEFRDGSAGRLFVQTFIPGRASPAATCLVVPPFAEEMNRSRRTMALLAFALAERGVRTVLPDLYGTGDSAGDFGDARWDTWRTDLGALAARCGEPLCIAGLRTGALLAAELAEAAGVTRLVLLQPVTDGRAFLKEFLRLGGAGALVGRGDGAKVDYAGLLESGEAVEIAGYRLDPRLYGALAGVRLLDFAPAAPVSWLHVSAVPQIPPAVAKTAETWSREQSVEAELELFDDPPFWRTQEISVAEAAVSRAAAIVAP